MAIQLYMIGVTVADMEKSRDFYRRLGVDLPTTNTDPQHVEAPIQQKIVFFLDTRSFPPDDATKPPPRMLLEFAMPDRAILDAKYQELIDAGYANYHAPFESPIGVRFALVDDPDGNTILLSTDVRGRDATDEA